ncbi:MAG: Hsp70 family protein [Defluviitaleaceae bacterium]|nr:Hsp70 family protein [Defluviitaleaceae bacterium]
MGYLGIDLGTTNSVAVIYNDKTDEIQVVSIDGGDQVLPSVVSYTDDGIIVGSEAKAGAVIYPEDTVSSVKRIIGSDEVIVIGDDEIRPEEVSAQILYKLKQAAEEESGETFSEVVITHPAYFNDRQIFATKQAGLLAGFENVYLLSEPLAAAIEYGYKQNYAQTLLVYDLGGGTFDACVLEVSSDYDGQEIFQELSDVGDMELGGDDFDSELIKYMKERFKDDTGINIDALDSIERNRAIQKLKHEAEQTKIKLSAANNATVRINPLIIYDGVPKNLTFDISREEFEALIRQYVDRTREIIEEALRRAGKEADEISKVILVGGSTLIPMVKRMVAGFLKEPYRATDPAKSVAMGAAIYNYLTHLPNSIVKIGQVARQTIGMAAITDMTTMRRSLIPIIPMGTPIPCKISDDKFVNAIGAQTVSVDVYQWDERYEKDRKYIGSVLFSGLTGTSKFEITYSIDENNLFEVFVKDLSTGKIEMAEFDRTKSSPPPPREDRLSSALSNVNIVFLIDTTSSMDIYINGVKDRAIKFAEILNSKGTDFRLGLIGYGDLYEKEKPTVYKFTNDISKFQKQVQNIPRTFGGDIPESSLDALETGVELVMSERIDSNVEKTIFILITDAPAHVPTKSKKYVEDICLMLESKNITTYVVAKRDAESLECYEPLTEPNGKYYNMSSDFFDILDDIAESIADLVRVEEI